MRLITIAGTVLATLLLTACATTPPPPRPAKPVVGPSIAAPIAPPVANWEDRRPTAGDWIYRAEPRGGVALFGRSQASADLVVACDRTNGRITLSRFGLMPSGQVVQMTLRATDASHSYPAQASALLPGYISAELAAKDPQLDAMVHSRGAFLISLAGTEDLIVPAWAEFARVVEECRR
ncbi:MAG: hypothetical protein EBS21_02180 [Sphingomonadaceae bacterium]|nr:hypothetical protein [Sphingomonadaceae bacterium]